MSIVGIKDGGLGHCEDFLEESKAPKVEINAYIVNEKNLGGIAGKINELLLGSGEIGATRIQDILSGSCRISGGEYLGDDMGVKFICLMVYPMNRVH